MYYLIQIVRMRDGLTLCDYANSVPSETQMEIRKNLAAATRELQKSGFVSPDGFTTHPDQRIYYIISEDNIAYTFFGDKSIPDSALGPYLVETVKPEFEREYRSRYLSSSATAYMAQPFETFLHHNSSKLLQRPKNEYAEVNSELTDVLQKVSSNIQKLANRGGHLQMMQDQAIQLKHGSQAYRKAAQRINWELLLKQYGPLGGLGLFIIFFMWWRFF